MIVCGLPPATPLPYQEESMANTTTDARVQKSLSAIQTAQTQTAPAGFVAPNQAPNISERIAQWNVFAHNQKDT